MKAWARMVDERRLFLSVLTLAEYDKGIANLAGDDPNVPSYIAARDALRSSFRRPDLVAERRRRPPLGGHLRTGKTRDRSSAARHRYLACGDGDRGGPVSGFSQHEGFAAQWSCSLRSMARRHRCVSAETASTPVASQRTERLSDCPLAPSGYAPICSRTRAPICVGCERSRSRALSDMIVIIVGTAGSHAPEPRFEP